MMDHIYQEPQFGENWFTYPNLYSRFVGELGDGSKIVEVGCWMGKSTSYLAVEIINSGKNIKIDAIDTWKGSPEHQLNEYVINNTLYELFISNISRLSHIITPIKMDGTEAASLYSEKSVEVVFIDADHSYEEVKKNILAWLPKVKNGGYISGHDYWKDNNGNVNVISFGVCKAVDEIFGSVEVTEGCWVHKIGEQTNG